MLRRAAVISTVLCLVSGAAKLARAVGGASGSAAAPSLSGAADPSEESTALATAQRLERAGQLGAAEAAYRKALVLREARVGRTSPAVTEILNRLASVLRREGKSSEAEQLLRRTVEIDRHSERANPVPVAAHLDDLHAVLAERGKWADAAAVAKTSLQVKESALGATNPSVIAAQTLAARSEQIASRTIPPPPPAPSPPPPPPAAEPAPAAPAPYDELDHVLASMRTTPIAYDPPAVMSVGETRLLTLVMSPSSSVDAIEKTLRARGAADPQGETVRYAPRMEAHLAGAGFKIDGVTPDTQAVSASAPTEWRWQITAEKEGVQALELSLNALVTIAGGDTEYAVKTFDRPIHVQVTPGAKVKAFVSEHVEWLFGLIVVPVAGLFWKKLRPRSSRPRSDQS
jgi:tetratricopeptide (TPR) repeat protein